MTAIAHSAVVEILSRVIDPANPSLSPDAAQSILELRFSEDDVRSMNTLAEKARAGRITADENERLHGYMFVGAMIDLMHSKARLSLDRLYGCA